MEKFPEALLPFHIKDAILREDSEAERLHGKAKEILAQQGDPVKNTNLANPIIEKTVEHRRMADHIRAEFGIKPKHKVIKSQIERRKNTP